MQLSGTDLLAGSPNGVGTPGIEQAEVPVGLTRRLFHRRQRRDKRRELTDRCPRDREIPQRTRGVHAVVGLGRAYHLTARREQPRCDTAYIVSALTISVRFNYVRPDRA